MKNTVFVWEVCYVDEAFNVIFDTIDPYFKSCPFDFGRVSIAKLVKTFSSNVPSIKGSPSLFYCRLRCVVLPPETLGDSQTENYVQYFRALGDISFTDQEVSRFVTGCP